MVLYRRPDARVMRFFTVDPLPLESDESGELKQKGTMAHEELLLPDVDLLLGKADFRAVLRRVRSNYQGVG